MRRVSRVARWLAAPAGALALALTFAGPASAATPQKGYAVNVSPSSVNGDATATMTATFKNEALLPRLATAELFPPVGIAMTAAYVATPFGQIPVMSSCRNGATSSPCIRLPGLALLPGLTIPVTIKATIAPSCGGTVAWSFVDPSNLPLDAAHSALSATIVDSCHLAFGGEPTSAIVGQTITTSAFNNPTAGGPVTVSVLDAHGAAVTSPTSVTVSLGNNLASATLGGTATQPTVGGIATFNNLTVSAAGNAYNLGASARSATGATSNSFDVQGQGVSCTGSCMTTQQGTSGSLNIVASGAGNAELASSVNAPGDPALSCTLQSRDPDTYEFVTNVPNYGKVVRLDITNPINARPFDGDMDMQPGGDGDNDADDVIWTTPVCFQAPYTFAVAHGTLLASGTVNGQTVYTGDLADCRVTSGPCIERNSGSQPLDENSVGYDIK
ncbi:MAG: hypothetical protein ACRDLP_10830, partial [Solirubrobacteraceae bacterium]